MNENIMSSYEPFADYQKESNHPGPGFYGFVVIYTFLAFLLIAPLVAWSREQEEKKHKILDSDKKQVEIEGSKNLDHERPSADDHNDRSTPHPSTPLALKGDKGNLNIKNDRETYSYGDNHGDHKRDFKNQSSTPLGVLRKMQLSASNNMGRVSSSSASSDSSGVLSKNSRYTTSKTVLSRSMSLRSTALRSVVLRELDQSYPDQDPEFQNRIAFRMTMAGIPTNSFRKDIRRDSKKSGNKFRRNQEQMLQFTVNNNHGDSRSGGGSNQPTETSSSVPSAVTTGKIQQNTTTDNNPSEKGFSKLVLDVGGRRWKNRRPLGRADVIENSFTSNNERQSNSVVTGNKSKKGGSFLCTDPQKLGSFPSTNSRGGQNGVSQQLIHQKSIKGMSDIASSILSEQHHQLNHQPHIQIDISLMKKHQLEQLRFQERHQLQHQMQFFAMQRLQQQQQKRYVHQRKYSRRSISEQSASVMSSIIDDISPDDAPDANDPGRGNIFTEPDEKYWVTEKKYDQGITFGHGEQGCCPSPLDGLLMLAVPDTEKLNVLQASIPLALGASSEALFRLISIAFISRYLGTESMIAFLLVGLFVRLTSEELSSAIIDSLSSFVQASMDRTSFDVTKSNYVTGQYIQLAFILQVILNIPLLVFWVYFMEMFVTWLLKDPSIAIIAVEYASIVVFAYMVQTLSRTLTVVFHICGHEHFESIIDLVAAAFQVVAIACVVTLVDGADLNTVGGIQVLISAGSAIAKIAYPAARGWMRPFRKGLMQNVALWNYKIGIWHLFKAAGPLLLGTVLEYGEWELLTLFVHRLGPAEVATWALLGAFWDFFEALTEGIGEAAANQVVYLLSAGQIDRAKKLCHGTLFMAVTQAVLVTSALYMSGQYLAILFTTNPAIQHIMNDNIVFIGFANVVMAFSQITWSLIGAQGRFRLATFIIFFSRWVVTMPCALISIYVFVLDLNAVSGSLVVGYATACCALTVILLRSDWGRLARLMQVMNQSTFVTSTIQQLVDEDAVGGEDVNADDPILGLVDLDNFDDSDDDSDGFGFGEYDEDDHIDTNAAADPSASEK